MPTATSMVDFQAELAQAERVEEAAFKSLFVEKSDNELVIAFFKWLVGHGWWNQFWAAFHADGIMTWLDFENFVHWEGKWTGDKRRVFKELAKHCGTDPEHPYIKASGVLDLKRWWEHIADPGKRIQLSTFKNLFADHYGNLGCAWRMALDPDDTGKCSFLLFCRICQSLGMRKSLKSIWESLTHGNHNRPISYQDWDPVGDRIVSRFAMSLCLKYGSMREGWNQIIKNAGGNMHFGSFVDATSDLGFDIVEARWLFAVLDKEKRRYLNQFDRLRFLSHWDPGTDVPQLTLQELKYTSYKTKKEKGGNRVQVNPTYADMPFRLTSGHAFEFCLELNEEEYAEYQKRLQGRQLAGGQDEEAMKQMVARVERSQAEEQALATIKNILSRPLVSRKFNNDDLLQDPIVAAFAQA